MFHLSRTLTAGVGVGLRTVRGTSFCLIQSLTERLIKSCRPLLFCPAILRNHQASLVHVIVRVLFSAPWSLTSVLASGGSCRSVNLLDFGGGCRPLWFSNLAMGVRWQA
ncbi:DCD (Development and Cell Death) domain protein, partial [Striga asiatica]